MLQQLILFKNYSSYIFNKLYGSFLNKTSKQCYDLRFPEFALALTKAGAEILTYPSAFTQHTGMAHWEVSLKFTEYVLLSVNE